MAAALAAVARGQEADFEAQLRTKAGERLWAQVQLRPTRQEGSTAADNLVRAAPSRFWHVPVFRKPGRVQGALWQRLFLEMRQQGCTAAGSLMRAACAAPGMQLLLRIA